MSKGMNTSSLWNPKGLLNPGKGGGGRKQKRTLNSQYYLNEKGRVVKGVVRKIRTVREITVERKVGLINGYSYTLVGNHLGVGLWNRSI